MILMWLGSFVLMMFGLTESQKCVAQFFLDLKNQLLAKGSEGKLGTMFFRSLGVSLVEASPQATLKSRMVFDNSGEVSSRERILLMCLSPFGAWWVLVLGFLFLSFSGNFVLGFCAVGLIAALRTPKMDLFLKWLFACGVFLIGGEMMLRNASIIQTLLGQGDLAFFLADGRFVPVLGVMLVSIILTFFIQTEFWAFALALSLLVTNTMSFNGALGLVVGERIAQMILFWWQSRSLSQDFQRMGKQMSFVSIIGIFGGFLIVAEARRTFYFGFSSDLSSVQYKSFQFVILFSTILFFQWLAQMIWGHFASQAQSLGSSPGPV